MTDGKHIVTECLFDGQPSSGGSPNTVAWFIGWLVGLLENAPVEFREKVEIEITGGEYYYGVEISYSRPETDDEQKARINRRNEYIARVEAREKEQLAALKRKYE